MSSVEWNEWLNEYERQTQKEQFLAQKIRSGTNLSQYTTEIRSLQKTVGRLKTNFDTLKRKTSAFTITQDELKRRELLLNQLVHDQKMIQEAFNTRSSRVGRSGDKNQASTADILSMQNQIMKDQDEQLEQISKGVATLHHYSIAVHDESELHVKLLDDIDADVNRATTGLESEGLRAEKVAERTNNCRLYLTIAVLLVILLFLLVIGGGR